MTTHRGGVHEAPRRSRGRSRTRLIWLVITGLLATGMIAFIPSANADQPVTERIQADFVRRIVLELPSVTLTKGEPRYFYGHYGAKTKWGMLQGAQIRCTSDGQTYESVNTTMDHPGDSSVRVVAVRWLFTPPETGEYTCAMNGFATTTNNPEGKYLTVVGGDRTNLTISRPGRPENAEWRVSDGHNPRVDIDRPATSAREDVARIMGREWTASPGSRSIVVSTGLEVSRVSTGGNSPFVARTKLKVTQLDAAGEPCRETIKDVKETPFDVHHIKVHHSLTVPISTAAGCTRTFEIQPVVQYVPHPNHPNPIRHGGMVEDGVYSNTIALSQ